MKRSRFSEEQIIAVLKKQEAGMPTADVLDEPQTSRFATSNALS